MGRRTPVLACLLVLIAACARDPRVDLDAERTALLAAHQQILASHRTDDLNAWLALEADTIMVGSRGDLIVSTKMDRTEMRRGYLDKTEFTVYRDRQPPVVEVSSDGTMGWVYAQVEVVGSYVAPRDTLQIDEVWAWIELYKKSPDGWRLVGNVSSARE